MKENAQLKGSLDQIRARNETLREEMTTVQKKLIEQQKYYEEQIRELVEKKGDNRKAAGRERIFRGR